MGARQPIEDLEASLLAATKSALGPSQLHMGRVHMGRETCAVPLTLTTDNGQRSLVEGNTSVLDYILVPATSFTYRLLWLSEHNLKRHKVVVFQTFDELARWLVRRVSAKSKVAARSKFCR
jgi:hypothetical protein